MRSERRGEFVLDRGAQFIASGYRNLHALARAARHRGRVHPRRARVERDAARRRARAGRVGLARRVPRARACSRPRAKLRLARLPLELWRHRRVLDPLRPERAADLDGEDLARGRADRRRGGARVPARARLSSTFDSDPEHLSGAFALLALRFVAGGFRLQCFEGGIGLLTHTLARELSVRIGFEVTSVETDAGGARVRYVAPSGERTRGRRRGRGRAREPRRRRLPEAHARRARVLRARALRARRDRVPALRRGAGDAALLRRRVPAPRGARPLRARRRPLEARRRAARRGPRERGAHRARRGAARGRERRRVVACALESLARTPIGRLAPRDAVVHRWDPMLPQFRAGYLPRLRALPRARSTARRASPSPATTWSAPTPRPRSRAACARRRSSRGRSSDALARGRVGSFNAARRVPSAGRAGTAMPSPRMALTRARSADRACRTPRAAPGSSLRRRKPYVPLLVFIRHFELTLLPRAIAQLRGEVEAIPRARRRARRRGGTRRDRRAKRRSPRSRSRAPVPALRSGARSSRLTHADGAARTSRRPGCVRCT